MRRNLLTRLSKEFSKASISILLIASGCASNQLTVESTPEGADVYVFGANNSKQKIGKTPLTLNNTNTPSLFKETIQISIQKDGFKNESIVVAPASTSASGRLATQLAPAESATTTNEVSEGVALIIRMINKKNFGEAERSLGTYTTKFSTVPIFWDLLGNVHYLQKNITGALSAYQTSLSLNPQNAETQKMITKIKAIRGSAE